VARVVNAHASEDIWHLSIEDLLGAPDDVPRVAGPGPFVINLRTSTAAISPPPRGLLRFERLHTYQIVRSQNGETQYRLRLGLIKSEEELEAILSQVREHYPGAMQEVAEADDKAAIAAVTRATDLARPPARSDSDARRIQAPPRSSPAPRTMQQPVRAASAARAPQPPGAPAAVAAPITAQATLPPQSPVQAPQMARPTITQRAAISTANQMMHAAVRPVVPRVAPAPTATSEQDYGWDIDELLPDLATARAPGRTSPPADQVAFANAPAPRIAARAVAQDLAHDANAVTDQFEALAEPMDLQADPPIDPTVELEADSLRQLEVELQVEPVIEAVDLPAEPEREPEAELQAAPIPEPEIVLEAEPSSEPEIELDAESLTEAEIEFESEVPADPDIDLEPDSMRERGIQLRAERIEIAKRVQIAAPVAAPKPALVSTRLEIPTLHPAPQAVPSPAPVRVQPPMPAARPAPAPRKVPEETGTLERLVAKIDAMIESAETHDKSARASLRNGTAAPAPARAAPNAAPATPSAARGAPVAAPAASSPASVVSPPPTPAPSRAAPSRALPRAGAPLMDSTQTVRALSLDELAEPAEAQWFAIELARTAEQIAAEHVPNLDIFSEYRLYSITGLDQERVVHVLRVGFFSSEVAAEAVAGYLSTYFESPAVKRVSLSERERFAERRVQPRKDVGASGTHAIIELVAPPPLPERATEPAVSDSAKRPALDPATVTDTGKRRALEGTSLWSRLLSPRNR